MKNHQLCWWKFISLKHKNETYFDGNLIITHTYSNFTVPYNLLLFNAQGSEGPFDNCYSNLIFYYCKIWDNDKLIRDFEPRLDSNMKLCLYDKVNNKYYYGKGGSFILGTE